MAVQGTFKALSESIFHSNKNSKSCYLRQRKKLHPKGVFPTGVVTLLCMNQSWMNVLINVNKLLIWKHNNDMDFDIILKIQPTVSEIFLCPNDPCLHWPVERKPPLHREHQKNLVNKHHPTQQLLFPLHLLTQFVVFSLLSSSICCKRSPRPPAIPNFSTMALVFWNCSSGTKCFMLCRYMRKVCCSGGTGSFGTS